MAWEVGDQSWSISWTLLIDLLLWAGVKSSDDVIGASNAKMGGRPCIAAIAAALCSKTSAMWLVKWSNPCNNEAKAWRPVRHGMVETEGPHWVLVGEASGSCGCGTVEPEGPNWALAGEASESGVWVAECFCKSWPMFKGCWSHVLIIITFQI